MQPIKFSTAVKKVLADLYTPVGIYLRLRDKFRDTILLESADFHAGENNYSIIGIHAIAGIEITNTQVVETKFPGKPAQQEMISDKNTLSVLMQNFMHQFEPESNQNSIAQIAQGVFGYTTYDAVQFFENIKLNGQKTVNIHEEYIPLMRYRLYQYVIIIDHIKDEMYICENQFANLPSKINELESIIRSKDVPVYPFEKTGEETTNFTDDEFLQIVQKGIERSKKGDTFQVVLSRRFRQTFKGDDFNVYRALRSINPSPYLFYFDYGDYKLTGSSPESQVIIKNDKVTVHPIAGTFKRTGNDEQDKELAVQLLQDAKENAEHVMLVDLARNDLSKYSQNVHVTEYKKVHYFSHVIHLVSKVEGILSTEKNPFTILGSTFPAGTLSGAPKYKAMQIIDALENTPRGFYGGTIGFFGFNGNCNHAIMIRTFLSKNNTLTYQAGAGIVANSSPDSELQEVNNKLGALKSAIQMAQNINP